MNPKIKILVVDDHLPHRQAVVCVLLRQGFEPIKVASGAEAINLLASEPVAAVVSDMEMPGTSGPELLQHIRRRYPNLPVVLTTPFYDEEVRDAAVAWGAAAVLARPHNGAQVTSVLPFALNHSTEKEAMVA